MLFEHLQVFARSLGLRAVTAGFHDLLNEGFQFRGHVHVLQLAAKVGG